MKIIVFGATGGVGTHVLEQAVAAGHEVTAFVRTPAKVTTPDVEIVQGDAFDADDVRALAGHDVVISALGSTAGPDKDTSLRRMATNLAAALPASGVQRVVWCASAGVDGEMPGLSGKIVMKLLAKTLADHRAAIAALRTSGVPLTVARPGALKDGPLAPYVEAIDAPNTVGANAISRASVADFLLKAATEPTYEGHAVTLGRKKEPATRAG
ncbi:NAD(P)-dependent oxidoreductase [Microbacterium gorillae]|uniref:NAD(P)-dependent oxidoreductase n=1 Tax=Microbacterium gorillae TaxID=1231063 RepID=UPI000693F072|nr:NAD(P)-binding oxidoreductase [Microbacterium gorillae]